MIFEKSDCSKFFQKSVIFDRFPRDEHFVFENPVGGRILKISQPLGGMTVTFFSSDTALTPFQIFLQCLLSNFMTNYLTKIIIDDTEEGILLFGELKAVCTSPNGDQF